MKPLSALLLLIVCLAAAAIGASSRAIADISAGVPKTIRYIGGPTPSGATPASDLPPGAPYPDYKGASAVVFPPQKLTIRFNHKKHMDKEMGLSCTACHAQAKTSTDGNDRMMPPPATCDGCHGSDHADRTAVKGGDGEFGSCQFCHATYKPGDGNTIARMELPAPHLRSNHKVHADRNINCEQCHGAVQDVELATREQLPRMKGCFNCHQTDSVTSAKMPSNECRTCHLEKVGVMEVAFQEGKMLPPRWMGNLEHTADFIERHKRVAGDDAKACASCHKEDFCTDCHDGRVRPRSVHANDYISIHPVEARLDNPHCASCHQEQQFCLPCHQRSGVTWSGSPGAVRGQGRFHPPPQVWSELPRTREHHAWEAQRNLQACVSCHTERDCAICHASTAAGGRGFNPHPGGFAAKCGAAMRKNSRACLVCHEAGDQDLASCK